MAYPTSRNARPHPTRGMTTGTARVCLAALAMWSLLFTPIASLRAQTDSVVRLDRLRADAKAHPDSFPIVLALGQALARTATELESDWRQRDEARKVLDRAVAMRPDDPRPFLETGLLLRKQGKRIDALRTLRRAEQRADLVGATSSLADRAELHYQMGLIYEVAWEDGEHLGHLTADFAVGSCPRIAQSSSASMAPLASSPTAYLVLYNFVCPDVFQALMENWRPLHLDEGDFGKMVEHFHRALEADPTRTDAAFRLLQHLAAANMWEDYLGIAEWLAKRMPNDPRVLLFLGLGYHEVGRPTRADSAFTVALDLAPDLLRDDLLDPEELLRPNDSTTFAGLSAEHRAELGDVFWRARDPLFLSPQNERLAEHLSRLAYVDVAYSTPQSGVRGRWTDRGAAWLRYGRPLRIRALDTGGEMLEFWDYGDGSPNLVFDRRRTYRSSRSDELSAEYTRYARARVPEFYAPEHPRIVGKIPFQAVAFRAADGGAVLEVYGALPVGALRQATSAPQAATGVFVVTGDFWEPRSALRGTRSLADPDSSLTAAFPLAPGNYVVSVEVDAGDVAAQFRQRLDIPDFGTTLRLSDLLLVDGFGAEPPQVDDRADLKPIVSPTRIFSIGQPIGIVWEIYGLQTDSTGVAHYTVNAEVADTSQQNAIIEALGDGTGTIKARGTRASWAQDRVPRADGAVVEYVTIDIPNVKPGSYRVFVTVTDHQTGRSFTAHAPLAVGRPAVVVGRAP
jgi:GWxTD domain-containing protein